VYIHASPAKENVKPINMKTKIQIRSIFGNLLFEFEKEDNTVKDTVIEAVKSGVNLSGAYLSGVNLSGADLSGVNLSGAYLSGAYLSGVKINDPEKIKKFYWILPEQGSFEAWKKLADNCIAKILIPAKAKRTCNLRNRKCRAEYVKTLAIWDAEGKNINEGTNGTHEKKIKYTVGKITKADKFDDSISEDCSHGIHFFLTKQEAIDWN
jgi:hypothetical protein